MTATVVGIDFGGVISTIVNGARPGSFGNLRIEVNGSFDGVKYLGKKYGVENLFIVSRCDEGVEKQIAQWLSERDFFNRTGFLHGNMRFCPKREDKAAIARELNCTHFIDNRHDVLWAMQGIVRSRVVLRHDAQWPVVTIDRQGLYLTANWPQALQVIEQTVH